MTIMAEIQSLNKGLRNISSNLGKTKYISVFMGKRVEAITMRIPQKRSLGSKNTLIGLILLLVFAALPSVASDLMSTKNTYLLCVDIKSKYVTHPSSKNCPKTSKELLINTQAAQGPIGLTGAAGLNGKDGFDGKTLWNGITDPLDSWGAPGDVFINTATKYLFGPKTLENTWPIGFSIVGPAGSQGIQGIPGLPGANGANGGQGPAGATGSAGATGATGAKGDAGDSGSSLSCALGGKCQIGSTGPGGGVVFYYSEAGFTMTGAPCGSSCHYLESANMNWNGINSLYWRDGVEVRWSKFGDEFESLVGTGRNIGTGFANTEAIIAKQGACETMASCTYIAGYIRLYKGGGKTDWFLPSVRELQLAILNASDQFLGAGLTWWTSTEDPGHSDGKWAWGVWVADPFATSDSLKIGSLLPGRPVRAF